MCSSAFSLLLFPIWFFAPWILDTLTSSNSQFCLTPSTQVDHRVLPPCAVAWNSIPRALTLWGWPFFPFLRHHCPVLPVVQCIRQQLNRVFCLVLFFFFKARYVKPILAIPSWVKRVENWHLLTIAISLI